MVLTRKRFSNIEGLIVVFLIAFVGLWISVKIYVYKDLQFDILKDWHITFFATLIYFMFSLIGFNIQKCFKEVKRKIHGMTGEKNEKK